MIGLIFSRKNEKTTILITIMAVLILIAIIATVYLLITYKTEEKIKEIIKLEDFFKLEHKKSPSSRGA